MNQLQRLKKIEAFKKLNEVNCFSPIEDEGGFSWHGCDICENGLGTNVYAIHGYSPKHKKIFELGDTCHECLCIEYNGIER